MSSSEYPFACNKPRVACSPIEAPFFALRDEVGFSSATSRARLLPLREDDMLDQNSALLLPPVLPVIQDFTHSDTGEIPRLPSMTSMSSSSSDVAPLPWDTSMEASR